MRTVNGWIVRTLASLAVAVGVSAVAHAAAWLDDFNNGSVTDNNPVSWVQNPFDLFPGVYDASSGDYRLSAPDGGDGETVVTWVDSVNFANVYIRTQGVILPGSLPEEVGGNLAVLGRIDDTLSAYLLYIDAGGTLGLQISRSGVTETLSDVPLDFNGTSEVILELNIIGTQISGYAWTPDTSKPAVPQLTAENDEIAAGKSGLGYQEDDNNTIGVYRYAASQDTPFVDTIPGDFNNDGAVDGADFMLGQQNSFATLSLPAFTSNYGVGADASPISAVPEPSALCLALGMAAVGAGIARRRATRQS